MAKHGKVISALRRAEKQLTRQLKDVRTAIESLTFGSATPMMPRQRKTRVARSTARKRAAVASRRPRRAARQQAKRAR